MNQTLEIIPQNNCSLNELADLRASGFSVLRSAHVGNLAPYNLAIADAGIPLLLVDQTITGVDKNYFPELILTQEKQAAVARTGRLVCRSVIDEVPAEWRPLVTSRNLDELHTASIRAAVPGSDVFTDTEYLRENEAIAGEVVLLAARNAGAMFKRVAQKDGTVLETADAVELVRKTGVLPLTDDPRAEQSAVLVPNEVNIIVNFMVEALTSERATQYHVSGPDMIRYMQEPAQLARVQSLYELIAEQASFGSQLPPVLTVALVGGAEARFATSLQRKAALDDLFAVTREAEQEQESIVADRKRFFTDPNRDTSADRAFTTGIKDRKSAADGRVASAADGVQELFFEPRTPDYVSQYDVLKEGGLYVPPQTKEMSFTSLASLTKTIRQTKRRLRP